MEKSIQKQKIFKLSDKLLFPIICGPHCQKKKHDHNTNIKT